MARITSQAPRRYLHRPENTNYTWHVLYSGKSSTFSTEGLLKSAQVPYVLWVPTYKVRQLKRNDVVTLNKKAFPGYTFVAFPAAPAEVDSDEREGFLTGIESEIKMQDPQFKFLRWPGGRCAGFLEEELSAIDAAIALLAEQPLAFSDYNVDDYVRIISGPFAGTVGQITDIQNKKVHLKVFFLGKQVLMEIPLLHLSFLITKN